MYPRTYILTTISDVKMIEECFSGIVKETKVPAPNSNETLDKAMKCLLEIAEFQIHSKVKFITEIIHTSNQSVTTYMLKTDCSERCIFHFAEPESAVAASIVQAKIKELELLKEYRRKFDSNHSLIERNRSVVDGLYDSNKVANFSDALQAQIVSTENIISEIIDRTFVKTQYQ